MAISQSMRASTAAAITEHWADCEEGGLPHRASNRDQVLAAFSGYFDALSASDSLGEAMVLTAIRDLYTSLDAINAEADNGLLETDERELLVPIIIDAAAAAGISPDDYDGEPGGEFRNF
jgi:hypothetical protein